MSNITITVTITSRAWGTLSLGILLALILGLIARVPQSDIVLIAAIRCIGIRPSTGATGLLLGALLVTIWLLILLLGLGEVWLVGVLGLVIGRATTAVVLLLLRVRVRGMIVFGRSREVGMCLPLRRLSP